MTGKFSIGTTFALVLAFAGVSMLTGCKTDMKGVETDGVRYWATVNGDVEEATEAAEATLSDLELVDVESRVTKVDGQATAKTADGTEVQVDIQPKVEGETSEVTTWVGTTGNKKLSKKIIAGIEEQLAD